MNAPEPQGPFPRAMSFRRLFLENRDHRFTEFCYQHFLRLKADAIRATEGEADPHLRGGQVARHVLERAPVLFEPQDLFATFALEPRTAEECRKNQEALWNLPSCYGNYIHIALDYPTLLKKGIQGLQEDIARTERRLAAEDHPDAARQRSFCQSARMSLEAVCGYAHRWRDEARRLLAGPVTAGRRAELERIRDALDQVPLRPARTLFEAMQSFQMFHFAMLHFEGHGISIGRADWFLDPYYRADLEAGRVTRAEAAEWMQLLMLRAEMMSGQGDSLLLAGCHPDGRPFWSDLTYFILDGNRALRQRGPQLWFRQADGMPRDLLRRCFAGLREGTSHPGFFYDGVAVPALERAGFSREHARDYVACQCVEISSAGRSLNLCGHGYHNLAKPVEVLLGKGKPMLDPGSYQDYSAWPDMTFPDSIATEYGSFDELLDAFLRYLRHLLAAVARRTNDRLASRPTAHLTLSSTLVDACLERGKAMLEGGALYSQAFPNFTGLVTAADSLAAIRQAVFEDRRLTLDELAEACRGNFEGREELRLYLLNKCPKYGNDDPRADSLAKRIYDTVADELSRHPNVFGEAIAPQYFSLHAGATHAFSMAATPDGRPHGEAPSGTLGGDLGRERKGLTALFNSVTSYDHTLSSGGLNVNLRLNRSILETDEDVDKMIDLLLSYFAKGGMEVQINCVSRETLLDAQKHPERHRDLCVRIAGQSAYFNDLGQALQEQVIRRVEHSA